jgi:hypothetical protein
MMTYPPYWAGGSHLVRRFVQKPDSKISASFHETNRVFRDTKANRQKNAQRYGYKFKERWSGHEVKVHRNGCFQLHVSAAKAELKFWTPKYVFAACEESGIPAVVEFSQEGLSGARLQCHFREILATFVTDELRKRVDQTNRKGTGIQEARRPSGGGE